MIITKFVYFTVQVPLVEQHYKAEFGKFLKHQYSVERVSGDSQLKISFPQVVEKNDIIICTAQILENSLAKAKQGDEDGIKLSRRSHFTYHHLFFSELNPNVQKYEVCGARFSFRWPFG